MGAGPPFSLRARITSAIRARAPLLFLGEGRDSYRLFFFLPCGPKAPFLLSAQSRSPYFLDRGCMTSVVFPFFFGEWLSLVLFLVASTVLFLRLAPSLVREVRFLSGWTSFLFFPSSPIPKTISFPFFFLRCQRGFYQRRRTTSLSAL